MIVMKMDDILSMQTYKYPDERIASNLYLISLSTSMGQLVSMEEIIKEYEERDRDCTGRREDYEKAIKKNEWLHGECPKCEMVRVFALDKIKECVDRDMRSCDGFFYYAKKDTEKLNLLVEMKNVSKRKMLEYMESDCQDSLYRKVCDSLELIGSRLEFEGGYSGRELIDHTHLLVVYGGRADTVSASALGFGRKTAVEKNQKGRQSKAAKLAPVSVKNDEAVLNKFIKRVKSKGLAACSFKYFGFPSREPREEKGEKGKERAFTMFSKEDMRRVIEDCGFFDEWEWGKYETWFTRGDADIRS